MIDTTIYDLLAVFTDAAINDDKLPVPDGGTILTPSFNREQVDIIRMSLEKQMPRVPDRVAGHPACSRCGKMPFSGDVYCSCCGQRRAKE